MVWTSTRRTLTVFAAAVATTITTPAFAQRVDTVSVGHPALNAVVLRPHRDTIDIVRLTGSVRDTVSQLISMAEPASGKDAGNVLLRELTGGVQYTTIVNVNTLGPLHHRTVASTDSADVTFTADHVRGWAVPVHEARKEIDLALDPAHLPYMAFGVIMRALPLRIGYEAIVHTYDAFVGTPGQRRVRVDSAATVRYRGRNVPAWVVTESDGKGTPVRRHWIARDSRQLLKALSLRAQNNGSELWWFLR